MKRALMIVGNFVLILAAASCTMGAVISAFWFTVDSFILFLSWAAAALVLSLFTSFWRARGLLILLVPVAALAILWLPEVIEGAKWMINFISSEYSQWLFVPVLFPGASATEYEQTLFFALFGILLSLLLSVSICLRRSAVLTILFTTPIVFLTFVLIFNQADTVYLIGLLAVYLTQVFSSALYPDDFGKRSMAVFPALALSALLMGAAYLLAPPANYSREGLVHTIDYNLRTLAARTGFVRIKPGAGWPVVYDDIWGFNTDNVEISEAGTRTISDNSLLEVTATHAGTYYLRGYSMRHFNGSTWTEKTDDSYSSNDHWARGTPAFIASVYSELYPDSAPAIVHMSIVRTGDVTRDVLYTPYFAFPDFRRENEYASFYRVEGNIIDLYAKLPPGEYAYRGSSYHNDQFTQALTDGYQDSDLREYGKFVLSRETYLQIKGSTAEGLRRIAGDVGIDATDDREEITNQVVQYISSFGRYSLTPLMIPEDEDFTLYFLRTSRQGYCIHYATAATLMLRSLGVPARFTSGFVVTVRESEVGQPVEVTDRNAHAWIEVFFEDYGWLPYEVTPPTEGFGAPDGRPVFDDGYVNPQFGVDEPNWTDIRPNPQDTAPSDIADSGQPEAQGYFSWNQALLVLIIAAAAAVALSLRVQVAQMIRKKRFAQADTNIAVICAWRYLTRLDHLKGWTKPPKTIEELALKARFSQHHMTEQERDRVVGYARSLAVDIFGSIGFFGRFWGKYVLGL